MSYELRSARWIAADVLRQVVQPGDTVVDATLGNGHDTLMLCELVGETGRVIGFDIQPDAGNARASVWRMRGCCPAARSTPRGTSIYRSG